MAGETNRRKSRRTAAEPHDEPAPPIAPSRTDRLERVALAAAAYLAKRPCDLQVPIEHRALRDAVRVLEGS